MTDMKVKAVAPWFGGKRTLAPEIVAELGKHTQYFEPFCGSAAVLFAKDPSQKETVSDLHGDLINLLWCVADPDVAPRLYERLQRAPFSQELLKAARRRLEVAALPDPIGNEANIDRAYWYFLASWMGRNGTAGTLRQDYQLAVRWTAGGGSPTIRWKNAVESMPAWHRRLLNVVILRRDAFEWLDRVEDIPSTAIYLDPPYVIDGVTRTGISSTGDNGRYQHDFDAHPAGSPTLFETGGDDHERLRNLASQFTRARVVISYYDCARVRELYDGWTFVRKDMRKNLHQQLGRRTTKKKPVAKKRAAKQAPEVLIINGPSFAGASA